MSVFLTLRRTVGFAEKENDSYTVFVNVGWNEPVKKVLRLLLAAPVLLLQPVYPQSTSAENRQLIIFHAGSLTVPFQGIIDGFKLEHPGVEVLKEIAGSRDCARKISELHQPCDVFASADFEVIDELLVPTFADWNLKFATNEMSIVYTSKSRRANEINAQNWCNILLDPNVAYGRSDPNEDPCGYRTIQTLELAEKYYGLKNLTERMLAKDNEYIRPKEVDLLSLLEIGELDYIFIYRSVAEQHHLQCLILPDSINLKRPELESFYSQASVELNGKKPGEKSRHVGMPMVYGVTIPKNAPHRSLAIAFLQYLLEKNKGLKVLENLGQPSAVPSPCAHYDKLPESLKPYALKPRQ